MLRINIEIGQSWLFERFCTTRWNGAWKIYDAYGNKFRFDLFAMFNILFDFWFRRGFFVRISTKTAWRPVQLKRKNTPQFSNYIFFQVLTSSSFNVTLQSRINFNKSETHAYILRLMMKTIFQAMALVFHLMCWVHVLWSIHIRLWLFIHVAAFEPSSLPRWSALRKYVKCVCGVFAN